MTRTARAVSILLALAACAGCSPQHATPLGSASAATLPADAQTRKIVAAADAFLASLTPAQKASVMFAFNDAAQRANWSNLPMGIVARKGVAWKDLSETQRAALMTLLNSVLSPDGVRMVQEQMAADDQLNLPQAAAPPGPPPGAGAPPAGRPPGGGGGGPGRLIFGSGLYYVAFLGTPSADTPWMLQFGGHHLAINATVAGGGVTLAPSLTGGQPIRFMKDGKAIYIVEKEVKEATAMLAGLTAAQRGKAVLGARSIDLVLGPGQDGRTLQPEGLSASEMTDAQKAQLIALIEARLDILNADDLAATLADIRKNLNQTSFAWYGPTDDPTRSYWRVTGPTLLLEFSPQAMGGDSSQHLHNMYRNPTNDYGAAWASLK
jgi:Protein of unknown function (DUF3500)